MRPPGALRPRPLSATSLALVVLLTALAIPTVPAIAGTETFADDFESQGFSGSTGSLPWATSWWEIGEADGEDTGIIQVDAEAKCPDEYCLVLGKHNGADAAVGRELDLSSFVSATLRYDFDVHKHGPGNGTVELEVSGDGGDSWSPLNSWALGTNETGGAAHNISAYLGAETRIRFAVFGSSDDSHLNIDNVEITGTTGNGPPIFDGDLGDRTDPEGALIDISAAATDPDGDDTLTYSAVGLPAGVTIDPTNGRITGALGPRTAGTYPVTVAVADDGSPSLNSEDSFTWTVTAGTAAYLVSGSGGVAGGDDLLTAVDRFDSDPATNEVNIGVGTGTTYIQAAAIDPSTGTLYAVEDGQLGTVDVTTGVFTALPSPAGTGDGPTGSIAFDDLEGLAFHPTTGDLYATQRRGLGQEDLLLRLDTTTGAHVANVFGGDDYLEIERQGSYWHAADISFDPTDGQLYAVHWTVLNQWSIATVNPETGATVTVGTSPTRLQSLAHDDTGRLYATTAGADTETLYELDKADGSQLSAHPIDNGDDYRAMAIELEQVSNQPPSFNQDLLDRTDDEGTAISLSAGATDPNGTYHLTYGATGLPAGLSIDPSTGEISGTIDFTAAASSPHTVTISVADNGSPSLSAPPDTFTWVVNDVNRPPVIVDPGPQTTAEFVTFNLALSASDPDGQTPTFSHGSTLPAWANLTDNGDGTATITGTPGAGDSGTTTVTITVSDGAAPPMTDSTVFDITVTNVNAAPSITNPGDQTGAEGTPFSLTLSASDPDGTTVGFSDSGTLPGWATLTDDGDDTATISGTPGFSDAATTTVTITASDGSLSSDAVFDIVISDTNRTPVLEPIDDVSLAETTPLPAISVAASDPDGVTPTLSISGLPAWASFTDYGDGTGTITGTPGYSDAGTSTVTVSADDGSLSADEVFTITVTDTDRPPVLATVGDRSLGEGTALPVITVTATDPDGQTPSISQLGLPPWAAFVDNGDGTATISGTPGYSDAAESTITITATSGSLNDTQLFTITVTEVNRAPVFDADLEDRTDAEGVTVTIATTATDPDGDSVSYSATGLPPGVTLEPSGVLTGVIGLTAAGTYPVQITATDDASSPAASVDAFLWTVTDTNRSPVLDAIGNRLVPEETAASFTVHATDPDGTTVSYTMAGSPGGATLDPESGLFSWTPSEAHGTGSYPITFTATDSGSPALTASETVIITVTEVNKAPAIEPVAAQANDGGDSVMLEIVATDGDLPVNALTFTASDLPPGLAINASTGLVTGTVDSNASGLHTVRVTVTDDASPPLSDTTTFLWSIGGTNQPPVIQPVGSIETYELRRVDVTLHATDPNGDTLTFTMDGEPTGATIDPASGMISWTPTEEQGPGVHTFTVFATDGGIPALADTQRINVTVREVNQAPTLAALPDRIDNDGNDVDVAVVAFDEDFPTNRLTYSATGLPPGLAIDSATGSITGTISSGDTELRRYGVEVSVTDNAEQPATTTAGFEWVVIPQEQPPTNLPPLVGDVVDQTVYAGDDLDLTVHATDVDPLTFTATGLAAGLSIDPATGRITGATEPDTVGSYEITITVTDAGTPPLFSAVDFRLTVTDRKAAEDKAEAMVTLVDVSPQTPTEEGAASRIVRRGLVVMSGAAAATTESMRLPMALLLALLVGFATIGRVGLYPLLWRGDRHEGTITFFDDELQFGLIAPDGGGEDVFVHAHAFPRRQRAAIGEGTRVRYRVLAGDNRASAWGATTEAAHD